MGTERTKMITYISTARSWLAADSRWVIMLTLILAVIFPFSVKTYILSLGIEVLIFAIFAMSLDLLLGYTGLPSLGHAAFFGLGAYILAYISSDSVNQND